MRDIGREVGFQKKRYAIFGNIALSMVQAVEFARRGNFTVVFGKLDCKGVLMTGRILHRSAVVLMLGAALVGIGAAPAPSPESASNEGTIVTAYTAPSVRAKLSFRM